MMITEEHAEWATVHRMRDMLVNVHDDYKVTHTYALFTTTLCWVMQRIRTNKNDEADVKARSVLEQLEHELAADDPWNITAADFDGFTAARFLLALRNATAHGDAGNIHPVNRNHLLVGHQFYCTERNNRPQVTWKGTIILERRQMQRIGIELADRFCDAFSAHPDGSQDAHFVETAEALHEEAA